MEHKQDFFVGGKNHRIFYQAWIHKEPKAIIQIIHGGVEHTGRYKHLVKYLTDNGFTAYGNDHRGHGRVKEEETISKALMIMLSIVLI